ncbi:MAG: GNAT family N-acetyltransferase [Defluviitaleaceae bacterium]|nr:GNAT family N-acetyltransferase [Defluviitaleaceae bacterium]
MLELRLLNDADLPLVEGWLNKKHVKRYYDVPGLCSIDDWIHEIKERHGEFSFLTHLIISHKGRPIGFCQYYKCVDSDEDWGALEVEGSYCIDYLIGEEAYLGKGLGKESLTKLVDKIFTLPDAKRIVADFDESNKASEKALLSSGFKLFDSTMYHTRYDRYVIEKEQRVSIRPYMSSDENGLFAMIEREGVEWTYYQGENRARYVEALSKDTPYLLFEGDALCGYIRAHDDFGFGVYVLDLLVDKAYRGKEYGRMLIEQVCRDFPNDTVYVMSDVNPYYEKLGYGVEGTIFIAQT